MLSCHFLKSIIAFAWCASLSSITPVSKFLIERAAYRTEYDGRIKSASWTIEVITAESLEGSATRAGFKFMEDPLIPAHLRATPADFKSSAYDKGHLVPAGNSRASHERMRDSFLMSNVSPNVRRSTGAPGRDLSNLREI